MVVIMALILRTGQFVYDLIKSDTSAKRPVPADFAGWENRNKPDTDDFLALMEKNKIDTLYLRFADKEMLSENDFSGQFNQLRLLFGNIVEYHFQRSSASGYEKWTGFFMYYSLHFDSGNRMNAVFDIDVQGDDPDFRICRLTIDPPDVRARSFVVFVNEPLHQ